MSDINWLSVILTYNRPVALNECLRTLFNNTTVKPDLVYILDDNSDPKLQEDLFRVSKQLTQSGIKTNILFNQSNQGVGSQIYTAFKLAEKHNPKIFHLVESDYIYRAEWAEDILSVFDAAPYTVGIPGMSHFDMTLPYKTGPGGEFSKLMIDDFSYDLAAREFLYRPFKLNTNRGEIEVCGVSNSCGSQILHWERIQKFFFRNCQEKESYWDMVYKACKVGGNQNTASDGTLSNLHSMFAEGFMTDNDIDISKNFGYLNIYPSISFHLCSQGLNGKLDPNVFHDGTAFPGVNCPSFPQDYNNYERKIS